MKKVGISRDTDSPRRFEAGGGQEARGWKEDPHM